MIRSVLHGQGHALIIVLKNRKRIDDIRRILSAPELCGYPTLIIDDEGDEASLNTQFKKGRRSAIYNSILHVRDALTHHAYIAYTATPQANLLISGIDGLSPDFGVLIEPGPGYCGGSEFFGDRQNRYIRTVPPEDSEHPIQITEGLRRALAGFLVGAAIRHLQEPSVWHSMLIHNSNLTIEHDLLKTAVQSLIELWRDKLSLPDTDPAIQDITPLLQEAYDDISTTVVNQPSWEEVYLQLKDEIWLIEVWMVNSLPLGRDPIGTPFRLKNNILVGGNMMGRGVTIPGLAVTYITRRAKNETNADTMEQRARWFGYKSGYLDTCRIYVTEQLRNDYAELLQHEDDFWEALRRNQRQGLSIKEWPRMLRLDTSMGLNPTRQSVASYKEFHSRGWEIQRHPIEDAEIAKHNIAAIRNFFNTRSSTPIRFGHVEHGILSDCPLGEVVTDLLAQVKNEGTDWDDSYLVEYLARLLIGGRLQAINVLLMASDEGGFRKRTKTNGAINPMQGHDTHRQSSHPDYYPGDEYIHQGFPQLQVHLVRLEGPELTRPIETSSLALFIPHDNPLYDLKYVVRDGR